MIRTTVIDIIIISMSTICKKKRKCNDESCMIDISIKKLWFISKVVFM